jgi:hypothetical protein
VFLNQYLYFARFEVFNIGRKKAGSLGSHYPGFLSKEALFVNMPGSFSRSSGDTTTQTAVVVQIIDGGN